MGEGRDREPSLEKLSVNQGRDDGDLDGSDAEKVAGRGPGLNAF